MRASKSLGTIALFAVASTSGLQSNAAEPSKRANPAVGQAIEEILVTSRRDEERIQDVPVAVSAFTEADLTRIAPNTLRDLDGLSPNVFIGMNTAGPSAGAIFIRGIGYADIEKTQSPQVGVIVDGVYQGTNTGQLIDLFDVLQVEINRGPQGVLYGKNTMGGMIVVTRIKPVLNEWHYSGSVQGGNYDSNQFKARVNVPLIDDTLALKLGAMSTRRDGYYYDDTRNKNVGEVDYQTYTAALLYQPTDAFTALFTYDHIKDGGAPPPQDPLYDGDNPFKNHADLAEYQRYDVDSEGLQISWDLGFATLTSITGYVDAVDDVGQDFEQFTQELRLSGDITDTVSYSNGYPAVSPDRHRPWLARRVTPN